MRLVIGVDPGSTHSGAALLQDVPGGLPLLLARWSITTASEEECSARVSRKGTNRGQQRYNAACECLAVARAIGSGTVVVEKCPVTARGDSGRAGSQAAIGWALGRCAGLWQAVALASGLLYDEIEVGPSVRRGGKRVKGGWRASFPQLKRMSELELVRRLWPDSDVVSEHVAAAILIGAAYLMGGK